ncbi:excisionase family protein [Stenomitos frigidus]|uniref:Uncharacterized protein n=1 Tax=Stenomitos frigidus ULC18 TaxID=2107698 RepID=A0A2T1DXW8_9CYAN|nr:excisionase family protein [Stenomitos frigidus]PSB25348.1 hypothetical protein C7B82_23755 [Stenomitos frigidus ULC18]
MNPQFCNKHRLSDATGLSPETFKKYRLSGKWIEGVHWQRLNSRCVLYNLSLILDWVANRSSPCVHQRAIESYLAALPSNQPKKRGRRAG